LKYELSPLLFWVLNMMKNLVSCDWFHPSHRHIGTIPELKTSDGRDIHPEKMIVSSAMIQRTSHVNRSILTWLQNSEFKPVL
jgi:hypothetical protein